MRAALDSLPDSRRSLLLELKRLGEATADDLGEALRVTVSAVRQQLTALAAEELVERRAESKGPGRPRHLYRLTPRAHGLFPAAYGELTNELLGYFAEIDPAMIDEAFDRRGQRRTEAARSRLAAVASGGFAAKVQELARILDEDGYLAEFEEMPDGTFQVTEHNCAILGVASRYRQACGSEIAFLRDSLPEADIDRVAHMVSGAHVCSYRVAPKQSRSGAG
jgi:DeoR family suf operon transcriptional repressor